MKLTCASHKICDSFDSVTAPHTQIMCTEQSHSMNLERQSLTEFIVTFSENVQTCPKTANFLFDQTVHKLQQLQTPAG